jgi:hypothetical protein
MSQPHSRQNHRTDEKEIMARLRCGMDDGVRTNLSDQIQNRWPVANVDGMMMKISQRVLQTLSVPGSVALGAKKVGPHVVVNAMEGEMGQVKTT